MGMRIFLRLYPSNLSVRKLLKHVMMPFGAGTIFTTSLRQNASLELAFR